jgi:hypothetical protein
MTENNNGPNSKTNKVIMLRLGMGRAGVKLHVRTNSAGQLDGKVSWLKKQRF